MAQSPMMRQYNSMRRKYPGTIVFFRLGDFYEMFDDDAKLVSGLLGLTLTARDSGDGQRAPMCGVPYHSAASYIQRLVDKGYKVAICEQMSDPAMSRGLVEREVVRIVTPGTVIAADDGDVRSSRYILCLVVYKKKVGAAYADVSTGEFNAFELSDISQLSDALAVVNAAEVIASAETLAAVKLYSPMEDLTVTDYDNAEPILSAATKALSAVFNEEDADSGAQAVAQTPLACRASAGLINYIMETQRAGMTHITRIKLVDFSLEMAIDRTARRNLELVESLAGERGNSLLSVLDRTVTSSGARTLRAWIQHPLRDLRRINARHDAVEYLCNNTDALSEIQGMLKGSADLARLLSKLSYRTLTPRDCLALHRTLDKAAQLKRTLDALAKPPLLLKQLAERIDPLSDLISLIERMISQEAPQTIGEGGIILAGYNEELDELRSVGNDGLVWMEKLEAKEREQTGIRNLKVIYNRVFGYMFEVSKSNANRVPNRFIRK
ncbi:MAG: DNA mismatch repair protein MutS, partial [Oscillospiraceae bacterium]|nr:DNA mismatch repair protein MutS [Oscillospiraceae bacterium]